MEKFWYVSVGGKKSGPVSLELVVGILRNTSDRNSVLVWSQTQASWCQASEIPEISYLLNAPPIDSTVASSETPSQQRQDPLGGSIDHHGEGNDSSRLDGRSTEPNPPLPKRMKYFPGVTSPLVSRYGSAVGLASMLLSALLMLFVFSPLLLGAIGDIYRAYGMPPGCGDKQVSELVMELWRQSAKKQLESLPLNSMAPFAANDVLLLKKKMEGIGLEVADITTDDARRDIGSWTCSGNLVVNGEKIRIKFFVKKDAVDSGRFLVELPYQ